MKGMVLTVNIAVEDTKNQYFLFFEIKKLKLWDNRKYLQILANINKH